MPGSGSLRPGKIRQVPPPRGCPHRWLFQAPFPFFPGPDDTVLGKNDTIVSGGARFSLSLAGIAPLRSRKMRAAALFQRRIVRDRDCKLSGSGRLQTGPGSLPEGCPDPGPARARIAPFSGCSCRERPGCAEKQPGFAGTCRHGLSFYAGDCPPPSREPGWTGWGGGTGRVTGCRMARVKRRGVFANSFLG
jgi:hypothetical protein